MGKEEIYKLNMFEIRCLRSKFGVKRMDRMKNEEMRCSNNGKGKIAKRKVRKVYKRLGRVMHSSEKRMT